jgi:hypothetical protein
MKRKWLIPALVFMLVLSSCGRKNKVIEKNALEPQQHQTGYSGSQSSAGASSQSRTGSRQANQESSGNPAQALPGSSANPAQVQQDAEISKLQFDPENLEAVLDFVKMNRHMERLKKEGLDDNTVILEAADDLWKFFRFGSMLLDVAVGDFNGDAQDEIVLLCKNPDGGSLLALLHMRDGNLVPSKSIQQLEHPFADISITDVIPGHAPEIFLTNGEEWPDFAFYSYNGSGWEYLDLENLGVDPYFQFVSVDYDKVSVGHRITSGVYGGHVYEWDGLQFVAVDSYYYDNRQLYKLPGEPVQKEDDQIPEVKKGKVVVGDVFEFVSVLGSDRIIQMKPGIYDFDKLTDKTANEHVSWETSNEDYFQGLKVTGVENLAIEALEPGTVEIVTRDAFQTVMSFADAKNVTLKNLVMGHGLETYDCLLEVLQFTRCSNIKLQGCTLYGSGAYGFTATDCNGLELLDSVIEECSYGAADMLQSKNIVFNRCDIRHNNGITLLQIENCVGVVLKDSIVQYNYLDNFINDGHSQVEFDHVTWQNNRFANDAEYDGEETVVPDLDSVKNWKDAVKRVFTDNGFALHSLETENQNTQAVIAADLKENFIYEQPERLKSFLEKIAEATGYFDFVITDDKQKLKVQASCTQEAESIYNIEYYDTTPYHDSDAFHLGNYETIPALTGRKLPVTIAGSDEAKGLGKPLSYGIFPETVNFGERSEFLQLEAIYPGNVMYRQRVGYSRNWNDRTYKLHLPDAFSTDMLIVQLDEEICLFDRRNNIIAVLEGDWELQGQAGAFTIKKCCRLKRGSLANLNVVNTYRSEGADMLALHDQEKMIRLSVETLEGLEKPTGDWSVIPNAPSTFRGDYNASVLQINNKTGIVRQYSARLDSWRLAEGIDYSSELPDKLCQDYIITKNAGAYGIQRRYSSYFRNRDDEGRPFEKQIIDVINISRPGVLNRYTEPMVLFEDFSYVILDESQAFWHGISNWQYSVNRWKPVGRVQPEDRGQWREVGRFTEGSEDFVWQVADHSNRTRMIREKTGEVLFLKDLNETPVKGKVVQILQYLQESVYILANEGDASRIYRAQPGLTDFMVLSQYGAQDVRDEFAGAIPNEPFSKIDSIRLVRSANPAAYCGELCIEVHSKTASRPVRLVPSYWLFHDALWTMPQAAP